MCSFVFHKCFNRPTIIVLIKQFLNTIKQPFLKKRLKRDANYGIVYLLEMFNRTPFNQLI